MYTKVDNCCQKSKQCKNTTYWQADVDTAAGPKFLKNIYKNNFIFGHDINKQGQSRKANKNGTHIKYIKICAHINFQNAKYAKSVIQIMYKNYR